MSEKSDRTHEVLFKRWVEACKTNRWDEYLHRGGKPQKAIPFDPEAVVPAPTTAITLLSSPVSTHQHEKR